jgi:hypothetical protein
MTDELEVQRAMSACRWILGWMVCLVGATIMYTWAG